MEDDGEAWQETDVSRVKGNTEPRCFRGELLNGWFKVRDQPLAIEPERSREERHDRQEGETESL